MKTLHHSLYLLTLLCTALLFSGCDDDDNLFFTQEEVVEGDIATGRQLPLTGNAINIYTTETDVVNVQNAHGNLVAAARRLCLFAGTR
jgi:predicted lipid carrier protein YhbT